MPRIFISYRRKDSEAITGRIYDRLVTAFGEDNVFQDVEKIPPGVDFRTYLRDQVAACDVVLVIIGQKWVSIEDEQGRRRLANPADFVRIEVENALSQGKHAIPVLVDGAGMPYESDLPAAMQDLCFRNAATIRHNPDFNRDASRLIEGIKWWINSIHTSITLPKPTSFASVASIVSHRVPSDLSKIMPPPFDWCEISAGKVKLAEGGYVPKGGQIFEVDHFWMAKYPVTNEQFEVFVTAKDGYIDPKWWEYSREAQVWRSKNAQPGEATYPGDELPRTNVTWYETLAFCHWLNAQISGIMITLPTEQQWQRAAQGDDGRTYPWGNDFDSARCNTKESGIGRPTPVTQYSQGASPYDVMDLPGNVWELCLTHYETGSDLLENGSNKVLRGGSFYDFQVSAAAAYRRSGPYLGDNFFRFRLVLSAPVL